MLRYNNNRLQGGIYNMRDPRRIYTKYNKRIIGSYKFNKIESRELTYDQLKEATVPHDQYKKGNVQQHRLY